MKTQVDLEKKIEELEQNLEKLTADKNACYRYWKRDQMKVTILKLAIRADLKRFASRDEFLDALLDECDLMEV